MRDFLLVLAVVVGLIWVVSSKAAGHFNTLQDCMVWRGFATNLLAAPEKERNRLPEVASLAYQNGAADKHTLVLAISVFNLYRAVGADGLATAVEASCPAYSLPNMM